MILFILFFLRGSRFERRTATVSCEVITRSIRAVWAVGVLPLGNAGCGGVFAAAFRAHQPPAIVQVFEVGTAIMLSPEGVIKPVDLLMSEQGMALLDDSP